MQNNTYTTEGRTNTGTTQRLNEIQHIHQTTSTGLRHPSFLGPEGAGKRCSECAYTLQKEGLRLVQQKDLMQHNT